MDNQATNKDEKHDNEDTYEFESVYANNTYFEPSTWDLKIVFGQLEQHRGKADVDWHTAVTLPWNHAKIALYYMHVNILIQESLDGPIRVRQRVEPRKPEITPEEEADPRQKALYEKVLKLYESMFGSDQ